MNDNLWLVICLGLFIGSALYLFWPHEEELRLKDDDTGDITPGIRDVLR